MGSDKPTRRKVMKLPSGKGGSFPVEREKSSQWEGRKLPSGKGGSSGVTKGPADPAVRGGAILGGAKSLFEYGTILKT